MEFGNSDHQILARPNGQTEGKILLVLVIKWKVFPKPYLFPLFACEYAVNRKKELKNLYGRIAEKFPFLAKQGLKGDSLDDLFGMTIFGQPKAGK